MKISLFISLAGNSALAVALVCLAAKTPRVSEGVENARSNSIAQEAGNPERATPGELKGTNFTWSCLESADYRTYVANLRSIGCPEQTIRDIIKADVHSLYARKREELGQGARASASGDLARLDVEERSVIATLLGAQATNQSVATGANAISAARPAPVRPRRAPLPEPEPSIPVAWRGFDGAAISLGADEVAAVDNVRRLFQAEMGDGQVDASDPSYRERWLRAQVMADDMLAAQLGQARFDEIRSQTTQPSGSIPDR